MLDKINNKIEEENRVNQAGHYSLTNCPKESSEMYYNEIYGYNDGYFYDIDDLEDYCEDNNIKIPKYVWGTTRYEFSLDASDIVENALEESYEDAWSNVDKGELSKLQIACDNFCKAHIGCLDTYYVDYNICIDLEEETNE